jgi:hypothetical protein
MTVFFSPKSAGKPAGRPRLPGFDAMKARNEAAPVAHATIARYSSEPIEDNSVMCRSSSGNVPLRINAGSAFGMHLRNPGLHARRPLTSKEGH